jgi:hypothetical protein
MYNMKSCDGCTACCSSFTTLLDGLKPDKNGSCSNLCETGCSIYNDRPTLCKEYSCLYTQGVCDGLKNPKESGFFVTVSDSYYTNQTVLKVTTRFHADKQQLQILHDWAKQQKVQVLYEDNTIETNYKNYINFLDSINLDKDQLIQAYNLLLQNVSDIAVINSIGHYAAKRKLFDVCFESAKRHLHLSTNQEQRIISLQNIYFSAFKAKKINTKILDYCDELYDYYSDGKYLLHKAIAYFALNQKANSMDLYKKIISDTNSSEELKLKANFNLSTDSFNKGNINDGLYRYLILGDQIGIWNLFDDTIADYAPNINKQKYQTWKGQDISGKNIICLSVAGIGDDIINIRFLKNLKEMGANVYYLNTEKTKDLDILCKRSGFNVIESPQQLEQMDFFYWAKLQTLPYFLNLDKNNLFYGNYIYSDKKYVEKWKPKIKENKRLKVGIRWKGNQGYEYELDRTVDLKYLYQKLGGLEADFYSLQIEDKQNIDDFPGLIDYTSEIKSWDDTLGIFENLDVVITSCTSVAHMSAAMGKKTYVLTPIFEYYPWTIDKNEQDQHNTYWYGENVKVFRKNNPTNWNDPIDELVEFVRCDCKEFVI